MGNRNAYFHLERLGKAYGQFGIICHGNGRDAMRRIIMPLQATILCVVFFLNNAIAEDWTQFRHDPMHTGVAESTGPLTDDILWTFNCPDGRSADEASPSYANGRLFIGTQTPVWGEGDENHLFCLNGTTGETIWEFTVQNDVSTTPAINDGKVYFGCADGYFYCLNENDGELLWSYDVGSSIRSSPNVLGDKVVFGANDGKLYCLNKNNGELKWVYSIEIEWGWGRSIKSSPAISKNRVFFGALNDNFYCLDLNDGTLIWNVSVGEDIESSPAIANGKVFFGTCSRLGNHEGKLYCLSEDTGELIWMYQTPEDDVQSSPSVANGMVFFGTEELRGMDFSGRIYCLDENTGDLVWVYDAETYVSSSPAVADGYVYLTPEDTICLDAYTGELIWSRGPSLKNPTDTSPIIADGKLYTCWWHGEVLCFGSEEGPPAGAEKDEVEEKEKGFIPAFDPALFMIALIAAVLFLTKSKSHN
jgi:outer membrane protein assembly factor BamB